MRLYPWIKEIGNRQELGISDCGKCKQMMTKMQRQSLGCGYEPQSDAVRVMPWVPPMGQNAYRGDVPSVCAGYSTSLPEVVETAVARIHWERGSIVQACGGEQPTEEMLTSVLVLESAFNEVKHWISTPLSEGGGGS